MLRSHGVAVWPYPVSLAEGRNEVYLSEFTVPSVVDSGETFEVKAALSSSRASSATVSLLRDGRVIRSTRRANWRRAPTGSASPTAWSGAAAIPTS